MPVIELLPEFSRKNLLKISNGHEEMSGCPAPSVKCSVLSRLNINILNFTTQRWSSHWGITQDLFWFILQKNTHISSSQKENIFLSVSEAFKHKNITVLFKGLVLVRSI